MSPHQKTFKIFGLAALFGGIALLIASIVFAVSDGRVGAYQIMCLVDSVAVAVGGFQGAIFANRPHSTKRLIPYYALVAVLGLVALAFCFFFPIDSFVPVYAEAVGAATLLLGVVGAILCNGCYQESLK